MSEHDLLIPMIPDGYRSAWAQFTIRHPERNALLAHLKARGIPSVVYYRTPAHQLAACNRLREHQMEFPVSENASGTVLSLPFHPYMTDEIRELIVESVGEFVKEESSGLGQVVSQDS